MKRLACVLPLAAVLLSLGSGVARAEPISQCSGFAAATIRGLKRLNTEARIYRGSLLKDIHPEAYAVFEKTRLNPTRALSAAEEALLRSRDLLPTHEQWRRSHGLAKKLNVAFATWYRSEVRKDSTSMARKVAEFLFPIRALTPNLSPAWSKLGFETTQRIIKKVLENPDAVLSESELIFLKDIGKLKDFTRFQADLQNGLRNGFMTVSAIKTTGKTLAWSLAGSAAMLNLMGEDEITRAESVSKDSPKGMPLFDGKVELIFFSPMPDAAVRIGGQIYHYGFQGVERISVKNFREGKALPGNHTRVELKLTEDERALLRDHLEAEMEETSILVPPWITAIGKTNQAIEKATGIAVPPVADQTQAGTLAYLKLLKLLGSEKIGDIRFAGSSKESMTSDRATDVAAGFAEGMVALHFAGSAFLVDLFNRLR